MARKDRRGGARPGAGRKPKTEETELIAQLSPYDDVVLEKMIEGIKNGDYRFIKLFFEYRFGKPTQSIESTVTTNNGDDFANATPEEHAEQVDRLMFQMLMKPTGRWHKMFLNVYGIEKGRYLSTSDIPKPETDGEAANN